MAIGLDKGDGLATLLAASDEDPRRGIFTSFGKSFREDAWFTLVFAERREEDGAGFTVAIEDGFASRFA
jgi:hypothetical protein